MKSTMQPKFQLAKISAPPVRLKVPDSMLPLHSTPQLPPLTTLPTEDKLTVYTAQNQNDKKPCEWSEPAFDALQEGLPIYGAVLLKGLPIYTIQDYAEFFEGIRQIANSSNWELMDYEPFGRPRAKLGKYDLAVNIGKDSLLPCHNEMVYNPFFNKNIGLMCLQDAEIGGESIIAHNKDITNEALPEELLQFVKMHGGLRNQRKYNDATNPDVIPGAFVSWQERCKLSKGEGRIEAEKFWLDLGFLPSQLKWDDNGVLTVANITTGIVDDMWCNIAHTGVLSGGDGTPIPKHLVAQLQAMSWRHTYAYKLQPGDWLVLDNVRVQHGRTQYHEINNTRTIVVNLWGKRTH